MQLNKNSDVAGNKIDATNHHVEIADNKGENSYNPCLTQGNAHTQTVQNG